MGKSTVSLRSGNTYLMAVCRFNQFGFCRFGNLCFRKHENQKCENVSCDVKRCSFRHPRKCRYYLEYKNCKFGSYCKYSHDLTPMDTHVEEIDKLKKNIDDLKKVIAEKDTELKEKDEEIKRIEKRIIFEKDKIIEEKDNKITNLRNKILKKKEKNLKRKTSP